jgi:hypothetical protein
LEKQKERDKRAAFKAKAASFEQRGPTADEVKANVQKDAASRKFNRLLSKQLASPDAKDPVATEINLRNQVNKKTPYGSDPNSTSANLSEKLNWEFVDQGTSGPSYYWNRTTNETTFDRPAEMDHGPNAPPPPPPPPPRRQLPGMQAVPETLVEPPTPAAELNKSDSEDVSNWELVTTQPGGDYYWNIVTNECTYEMPACIAQLMGTFSSEESTVVQESVADSNATKWEAKWDEAYQAFYYLNVESGESTWEKPPGLA